jgi:hypothetical protein
MARADRLAKLLGRGASTPAAAPAPPQAYVRIAWPEDKPEQLEAP